MTVVQERAPRAPDVRVERPWALCITAYVVLVGLTAVVVTTFLVGTRDSTLAHLKDGVRSGRVTEVTVSGGLEPGSRGSETAHLTWRDRFGGHATNVLETSRHHRTGFRGDETTAVVHRPVVGLLRSLRPDVRIRDGDRRIMAYRWSVLGWHGPATVAYAFLVLWVLSIGVVAVTASPRRATPWAWAWIVLGLPVVGGFAFLMLSGVTRRRVPTPYLRPRLTGGWAFLLVLVLAPLINSA